MKLLFQESATSVGTRAYGIQVEFNFKPLNSFFIQDCKELFSDLVQCKNITFQQDFCFGLLNGTTHFIVELVPLCENSNTTGIQSFSWQSRKALVNIFSFDKTPVLQIKQLHIGSQQCSMALLLPAN